MAMLVSPRQPVWVCEDVVGTILFRTFRTAFIIPVHARVSSRRRGTVYCAKVAIPIPYDKDDFECNYV